MLTAYRLLGVDFTSAPRRAKPITVARGRLSGDGSGVHVDTLDALVTFEAFETLPTPEEIHARLPLSEADRSWRGVLTSIHNLPSPRPPPIMMSIWTWVKPCTWTNGRMTAHAASNTAVHIGTPRCKAWR